MTGKSFVVVFPSVYAKNKIPFLISNIKKILKIKNQKFDSVKRDRDIITVEANDPVFTSSAIGLLFGIKSVTISRQTNNDFESIVNEITKIGGNLLLKGEKFYVKVEGPSSGFLTKDLELAATSSIIEKKENLGAKPGTETKHDKLLYTYLTPKNAYITIFTDKGHGGLPNNFQNKNLICPIYDEFSAISCIEAIKQGFIVKIIVIYRKPSELIKLAKILNRIIPFLLKTTVELDFIYLYTEGKERKNHSIFLKLITELLTTAAQKNKIKRISLPLNPFIFSPELIESILKITNEKKIIPYFPAFSLDEILPDTLQEFGFEKESFDIEKLTKTKSVHTDFNVTKIVNSSLKNMKTISVPIGPNNVHDILDSLK